ncbi:MAG: hypothetical protein V4689_15250 [Verrucomicrobiota bacterium]
MVAAVPASGGGVHGWLHNVARQLHFHRDRASIISLLTSAVGGCGRHVPAREIEAAVDAAAKVAWMPSGSRSPVGNKPKPQWPSINSEMREAIIKNEPFDLASLADASPMRCDQESTPTEWLIDEIFPGNPLLCVGKSAYDFRTAPRNAFRGHLARYQFITPSAMLAKTGLTKEGKVSEHCLENTGARMFLVTEFDSGSSDEQAALIWHLRKFAPLAMALSSGGKSIHAWWNCQGLDESVPRKFMRYAVSLGADHATWTRSQFVRMPNGWRPDKKKCQEVYFFNQDVAKEVSP